MKIMARRMLGACCYTAAVLVMIIISVLLFRDR